MIGSVRWLFVFATALIVLSLSARAQDGAALLYPGDAAPWTDTFARHVVDRDYGAIATLVGEQFGEQVDPAKFEDLIDPFHEAVETLGDKLGEPIGALQTPLFAGGFCRAHVLDVETERALAFLLLVVREREGEPVYHRLDLIYDGASDALETLGSRCPSFGPWERIGDEPLVALPSWFDAMLASFETQDYPGFFSELSNRFAPVPAEQTPDIPTLEGQFVASAGQLRGTRVLEPLVYRPADRAACVIVPLQPPGATIGYLGFVLVKPDKEWSVQSYIATFDFPETVHEQATAFCPPVLPRAKR